MRTEAATKDRVVVVGTSVGGIRTAQALRDQGWTGDIVVVGAEDRDPYDKPPLSKGYLAGEQCAADIALLRPGGWADQGITPILGRPAIALDPGRQQVILADGERVGYRALVIATGALPRTLPSATRLSTSTDRLVRTVRELRDSDVLREQLRGGGPVLIVGSGFIGAEVASTARRLGLETTIVEALPRPFARAVGDEVASWIHRMHTAAGVRVLGSALVDGIERLADGTAVVDLADGRRLEAATVVVGVGVVPATSWLEGSGIDVTHGVLTDQHCRAVGVDAVYAVGDVARWYDVRDGRHHIVEHWTNAVEQANLVAHNLLHPDDLCSHVKAPYFWSDQHGVKIQMVGRIGSGDRVTTRRFTTPSGEKDIAIYSRDGSLSAAVAFGWPRAVVLCRRAWERNDDVSAVLDGLIGLSGGVAAVPAG